MVLILTDRSSKVLAQRDKQSTSVAQSNRQGESTITTTTATVQPRSSKQLKCQQSHQLL